MRAFPNHFRAAWAGVRGRSAQPNRRHQDEFDFLPAHLAIVERPPARGIRFFVWSTVTLCVVALAWAILGRVDVIASAPGRLIVSQHSKMIQAPGDGVVTRILVRDGQKVRQGEPLIELNPTEILAEKDKLDEQIAVSTLEIARLRALSADDPAAEFIVPLTGLPPARTLTVREHFRSARREIAARDEAYGARLKQNVAQQVAARTVIKDIDLQLANIGQRLQARQVLANAGNFPRLQLLELEKERIELQRLRTEKETGIAVLAAEGLSLQRDWDRDRATTRRDLHDRLKDEERKLSDARQDFLKAAERSRQMTMISPVEGVVQQLAVHTIGGVTKTADNLMVVVPDDAMLEAEISLASKDVGFVAAGQPVEVKVDSFPYTKYGTIRGTVANVSCDSAKDEKLGLVYPTRLRLDHLTVQTENGPATLSAGMSITAEIKTGDRRVIEYLLSPLQEYLSESLKER